MQQRLSRRLAKWKSHQRQVMHHLSPTVTSPSSCHEILIKQYSFGRVREWRWVKEGHNCFVYTHTYTTSNVFTFRLGLRFFVRANWMIIHYESLFFVFLCYTDKVWAKKLKNFWLCGVDGCLAKDLLLYVYYLGLWTYSV